MSQTELDQLERDVETARDRVTQDLERLRSPSTLSDFKDGIRTEAYAFRDDLVDKAAAYRDDLVDKATAYRDDFVDKTTNAVRDRAQGLLADIKARAAANPLAALAIGAGLAWRLLHKPPIATILVGGGLVGLLKTDPRHPAMGAELVPQARDLAIAARDQARDLALAVRDKAEELGVEAGDMVAAARTKLGEWTEEAGDAIARAAVAAEPATETLQHWGADAQNAVSEFGAVAKAVVGQGSETIQRIVQDPEERDKYLLGAAAVALIAAVGIASHRT
jgi:hypothetical protein